MAQEKNQNGEIELFAYDPIVIVRDVLRHWALILMVAILVGMGAYVATERSYVPRYTTKTTFVVSTQGSTTTVYQNLSAASNLASVFSEVLNSSILHKTILETLELPRFDGTIRAAAAPDTNLLTLEVTDKDPRIAFLVARTIIENHQVVSKQVMGDTILEVLMDPRVPTAPSNPMPAGRNMKKAALLGGVGMCVLLAAYSAMRNTVRSKKEAEQKLDSRILVEYHHEKKLRSLRDLLKKRKTSILVTDPNTSFSFVEKTRRLRRQVEQRLEDGKVIMVTSVQENEGKSTVAVNLALSLAQKKKKVLLMDADLRKPACFKILEQDRDIRGMTEVLTGELVLNKALVPYKPLKTLTLLLESKECRTSTELISSDAMERLLDKVKERFDYIIVDTPPMTAAADAESLAELTDASLLVIRQNGATVKALENALDILREAKAKFLGSVLNNVYTSVLSEAESYGYGHSRYGNYGEYGKYGAYHRHAAESKAGNDHES